MAKKICCHAGLSCGDATNVTTVEGLHDSAAVLHRTKLNELGTAEFFGENYMGRLPGRRAPAASRHHWVPRKSRSRLNPGENPRRQQDEAAVSREVTKAPRSSRVFTKLGRTRTMLERSALVMDRRFGPFRARELRCRSNDATRHRPPYRFYRLAESKAG